LSLIDGGVTQENFGDFVLKLTSKTRKKRSFSLKDVILFLGGEWKKGKFSLEGGKGKGKLDLKKKKTTSNCTGKGEKNLFGENRFTRRGRGGKRGLH